MPAQRLFGPGEHASLPTQTVLPPTQVTVHITVGDVRAKGLAVDIARSRLRVALRGASEAIVEGALHQPVRCDESTWMIDRSGAAGGTLVLTLAKDNKRAANDAGPSSEWWHGLFAGEDTLDTKSVSVEDYVSVGQLEEEQRGQVAQQLAERDQATRAEAERKAAVAATEASLPSSQKEMLASLRAQFPDIPIEYGDTSGSGE